jgi:hypothetical protein
VAESGFLADDLRDADGLDVTQIGLDDAITIEPWPLSTAQTYANAAVGTQRPSMPPTRVKTAALRRGHSTLWTSSA